MDEEISTIVVVTKIESYTDPKTGRKGKKIEFVNIQEPRVATVSHETPESRIVRDMLMQLKTMGFPFIQSNLRIPKMILYLLDEEEKALNLNFIVNHIYKIVFDKKTLKFEDVTREYYFVK